jgi:hypothetical protein
LECQIEEDEKDSGSVSGLIVSSGVLGDASGETRGGDQTAGKTDHEHPTARIDLVMEPSAQRVVYQTY